MKLTHLTLLAAFFAVGCASNDDGVEDGEDAGASNQSTLSNLYDRTWNLEQYSRDDGSITNIADRTDLDYSIAFSSIETVDDQVTGEIEGSVDCNGIGGDFVLMGDALVLSDVFATEIACNQANAEITGFYEQTLFNSNNTLTVSLEGDRLELTTEANENFVFTDNDAIGFSLLQRGDLGFIPSLVFEHPRFQVISTNEELQALYSDVLTPNCPECDIQPLDAVDFTNSTVILVAHEIVGSGGYDINVENIINTDGGLTVDVVRTAPGSGCAVTTAITGPWKLYTLSGVHTDIEFIERDVSAPSCE